MNLDDKRVMIIQCDRYEVNMIKIKLKEGLEPLGGMTAFVRPKQKVLLKPNLLMAKKPETVATTHPAVVQAVTELVEEAQGEVIIGDSPGGPFTKTLLHRVYQRTGMEGVADATDAKLNWNFKFLERANPDGLLLKVLTIGQFIEDADVIINLPKLKTHGLTKMTGGVKNLFGAIPGLIKAEYHLKMQNIKDFSNILLDIAVGIRPQLTIMDGIIGMEGAGPSGGNACELNTLLISTNPFAVDIAAAELVKVKPESVPTIKMAGERGLPASIAEIELLGVPLNKLQPTSFLTPEISYTTEILENFLPGRIGRWLANSLRPKPIFDPEICTQCGDCIRGCPPQVIKKMEKGVSVDLEKCIRCFCCQELCPQRAVKIHRPFISRLIFSK